MSKSLQVEHGKDGNFARPESAFRDVISNEPGAKYPAEKGRYALYVSALCPWAHRTLIVRAMKKLDDVIDAYYLSHGTGSDMWVFNGEHGTSPKDPLYGFTSLRQLYLKANPDYQGRFTVPVLWDKQTGTVVNNESSEIIRMLYASFDAFVPERLREVNKPGGGLYPERLRRDIDEMNEWVYHTVNNGVYKAGFAAMQEAYDENVRALFASLDRLEAHLEQQQQKQQRDRKGPPFLFGDHITEADIRLYTTLARFDVAYHTVFLCNLKSIRHDYPRLHLWLRRLYWDQGGKEEETTTGGGAFYKTTEPWIGMYAQGYAAARAKAMGQSNAIFPRGPKVLMEPLEEGEKL
ncbi:glutathione S-transferase [Xylariomycetidae sp. FL2044]|nr:glutathione S-transferase [Xylariomycetidae sp. FL2044]